MIGLPPLKIAGSFGAGPSKAANRVGAVNLGGLNVPAYPSFALSEDIADRGAGPSKVKWSELEMIGFVAFVALIAWVEFRRRR